MTKQKLTAILMIMMIMIGCSSPTDDSSITDLSTASPTRTSHAAGDSEGEFEETTSVSASVSIDREISNSTRNISVSVQEISVDDRAIYVTLEAQSRDRRSVALAYNTDAIFLSDDLGNSYPWQPPQDNDRLVIALGDQLRARLGFVGPIDEDAESLTLHMNYRSRETSWQEIIAQIPSFKFENLPIPGR